MAPNMHESGVCHCLIKVSVEKVVLPHGFVSVPLAFYHSRSPTVQCHLGPPLRDLLPCISALLRTIEIRL